MSDIPDGWEELSYRQTKYWAPQNIPADPESEARVRAASALLGIEVIAGYGQIALTRRAQRPSAGMLFETDTMILADNWSEALAGLLRVKKQGSL